ncbi:MAG TPA: tetratricopeptide repeat protein [Bacteroidota bacterium]
MDDYEVKDFDNDVVRLSATVPVVVDFWAEWCGPCRLLTPILERLAGKYKGTWELRRLNTEQYPDVAAKYSIRSIPNVKMFFGGTVINEFVGALPEAAVERWLGSALPDKHNAELDEAELFLKQHRKEDAAKIVERVLTLVPGHERAKALLALSMVFSNPRLAAELVASIDESSPYHDNADTVRTFGALFARLNDLSVLPESPAKRDYVDAITHIAEGRFDAALKSFISVIRNDRYYDDDGSRKACVAIFRYLGEDNDVTLKHRRDFGSALYA